MGQAGPKMRRQTGGFMWWCPACEEEHPLPDGWTFDGNLEAPTFTPSFKHTGKRTVVVDGKWAGDWVRDASGNPVDWCCHYVITKGQVYYCPDCTHSMKNTTIKMPDLPAELRD